MYKRPPPPSLPPKTSERESLSSISLGYEASVDRPRSRENKVKPFPLL